MAFDMQFVEFAKELQPYLAGGRTTGEYVRALFLSVCNPPSDGLILSSDEATFRNYLNGGRRGITKPAQEALNSLDREKFIHWLQELSPDALDSIAKRFVSLDSRVRAASICEDCADIFIEILKEGSVRRRASTKDINRGEEARLTELVIDEGNACPVCGSKLVTNRSGSPHYRCRVVQALPPTARTDYRVEREYLRALPAGTEGFSDVAELVLCRNCADKYEEDGGITAYAALARSWEACKTRDLLNIMVADAPLDDRIAAVIQSIIAANMDGATNLRMEPLSLKRKIAGDNALLVLKVRAYVTEYYKFIEGCFSDLDDEGRPSFALIASQVKTFYLSINEKKVRQSVVFDAVSDWIGKRAHSSDRAACEALTSFFIQNCEVFDEIAE